MSATDMAWLFSEAVLPAKQAYMEREHVSEVGNCLSFATVTLHTKSISQVTEGFTAVICFKCYQTYVDIVPARCECGEKLDNHMAGVVSSVPNKPQRCATSIWHGQTQLIMKLQPCTADPWETHAVENFDFVWPPWAIPPSIISGDTMTTSPYGITSPYVSQIKVAAPPPPPLAILERIQPDTQNKDIWLVVTLLVLLLGFLYLLRTVLAL